MKRLLQYEPKTIVLFHDDIDKFIIYSVIKNCTNQFGSYTGTYRTLFKYIGYAELADMNLKSFLDFTKKVKELQDAGYIKITQAVTIDGVVLEDKNYFTAVQDR